MKNLFERFRFSAGGYGGMLFISVLGLAILIFGGILTNLRQVRELRDQIDDLEERRELQEKLRPVAAEIGEEAVRLAAIGIRAPAGHPATPEEIPGLKEAIAAMTGDTELQLLSVRHFPEHSEGDRLFLRVEIRLLGPFPQLRPFLNELLAWEFRPQIEGFSLRAAEGGQEMQLILRLTVT